MTSFIIPVSIPLSVEIDEDSQEMKIEDIPLSKLQLAIMNKVLLTMQENKVING